MKIRVGNEKGMTLALVLMVMAILSILGITLLTITVSETKQVSHQDKRMQAYYLAKSGADTISGYILKNPDKAKALLDAPESNPNNQISNGTFKVDIVPGNETNEIKVKATGIVSDIENTSTVVMKKLKLDEILNKAIYTNSDLDIQAMTVTGDIQSGGSILYSNSYTYTAYPNQTRTISLISPFPAPSFGAPNLVVKKNKFDITDSANYTNIDIANDGILNITTGGKTIKLIVNNLTVKGTININSSAGGSVEIYINNKMSVTTSGLINNDAPKSLFVYLKKDSTFEIQANMVLNGYVIGPEATVMIQSSKSTINGAIFANVVVKNAVGNGGHGIVHYIPLAKDTETVNVLEYKILRWEK